MTVERLLDEMSSAELSEWMAYYRLEPFGEPWAQTGQICAMVGNAAGGKRGGHPFRPGDFLPVRPPIKRQTPEQMLAIFRILAAATGGNKGPG